ncbi:Omp85 domain-containing protein [Candida albicans]
MVELQVNTNPDLKSKLIEEQYLQESNNLPIYLTKIEVVGGESFSNQFFQNLLSPILQNGDLTFIQLVNKIKSSQSKLIETGIFDKVAIQILPDNFYSLSSNKIKSYNNEPSLLTKVLIDLSAINLSNNQGFFNFNNEEYLNLKLNHINHNFNGNGELISIGVDYNPYKPLDHLIANGKFISYLKNPKFKFLIDLQLNQENNEIWQDTKQEIIGGKLGLLYGNSTTNDLSVFTGFQLLKRNLINLDDGNFDSIKFFNGQFLKSSILNQLKYQKIEYLHDQSKNFPKNGYELLFNGEISSNQEQLNANNRNEFIKTDLSINLYKSLFNEFFTTKFQAQLGGIYSFNNNNNDSNNNNKLTPIHPSDKFYLGGYNSFPGFSKNSVELQGGDQYYKLQTTLYSKIPSLLYAPPPPSASAIGLGNEQDLNPLRIYATGIIGNVVNSSKANLLEDENGAISYGFGLKYFNNWANFDIGYFFSKRLAFNNDTNSVNTAGIKDGLHFSISIGGSNNN